MFLCLWAIAAAMQENGIHGLALPAARLPPGATLPEGFPMSWLGTKSVGWDSTGMLVDNDLFENIVVLDEFCSERHFWIRIQTSARSNSSGRDADILCCSFYCSPGGDIATWTEIVDTYAQIRTLHPGCKFFLLGDGNTHLSYLVDHAGDCGCLHCKQPAHDVHIQQLIEHAGLRAINPQVPSHDMRHCNRFDSGS